MEEILNAFGWEEIKSKNIYMQSFIKEDKRLNYYYTTGTVTIQSDESMKVYKNIVSQIEMEKIIS